MARDAVETHFTESVAALSPGVRRDPGLPVRPGTTLTGARCRELFEIQLASRLLDIAARWLREQGEGFYTIGSAGHEGNAAVGAAVRPTDPALLHYRSGAFYLTRSAQAGRLAEEGLRDVLLGLAAAAEEPISGGRHKVFGHPDLAIIPQTSTIASHLPRAVGVAFAIERARKLGVPGAVWPADSIAVCGFGDASVNHASALTGFNTAAYCAYQGLPLPLLFVCEDNGIGISVRTPPGWIEAAGHPLIPRFQADGCDLPEAYDVAREAVEHVRTRRSPAFLHLRTVRLMGHAGSDVEPAYRAPREIAADLARDPLLATAKLLVDAGLTDPEELLGRYETIREHVLKLALESTRRPRLRSAEEVMEPLAPRRPAQVAGQVTRQATDRVKLFGETPPEREGPLTLAQAINRTLCDILGAHPEAMLFGEDVARKGGVYGVTRGLLRRFGAGRVFDTLLDEQALLGLALGSAASGLLPIPEIQYLAYLHNALDQLRGEAATLRFFSKGAYRNPMVVRVASYAYQKGFGGHFHNDNSVAALRDIPGLVIASPARPDDAAAMLRTCVAAARTDGEVCVFLEPIALYHTRDLLDEGDNGWLTPYAPPSRWAETHVPIGRGRAYGDGRDLTIVTFGNGLRMSLRAAIRLTSEGHGCRVLDLRWLSPLPVDDLLRAAELTGKVLVADETRGTGGVSEGVIAALADGGFTGRVARVTSRDSFIPLGDAAAHVLLSESHIEEAARKLLRA
ncbi:thiamine pyrophosphate-dependent enzyme [Sphaerisporangium corydalis]|uniref:Thiamine pyrophosphate-dependent enzyme n=1 Tax=Sphaerisporangium corydalis TaxID=1441875 RepID=A0ABV9E7Q0_9ACTN|nr:thiamine pyrophosphate-dependent enzyme [Sphaerisporangium corydalis]